MLGPDPFPRMVRDFHRVIGDEARLQLKRQTGTEAPDLAVACVGGGSNSIGLFTAFLEDTRVRLIGVEAGGRGFNRGEHAARFSGGSLGVLHGTRTFVLQDEEGQISTTHSVSAGLDYPAVGPEHVWLHDEGRVEYTSATDEEAIAAFHLLARTEGILPALESAHAIAEVVKRAPRLSRKRIVLVNLSGRGDKDVESVLDWDAEHSKEEGERGVLRGSGRPARRDAMSAIDEVFFQCAHEGRAAFIPFLMAGDPDLRRHRRRTWRPWPPAAPTSSSSACRSAIPIADGPVNQRAAVRALASGTKLSGILQLVARHRDRLGVPIVLFTYFNPIHARGVERFAEQAAASGVDGVLCVDLPPEEGERELLPALREQGVDTIFLLAPTSTRERVERVGGASTGFVYYVSRTGVTGERAALPADLRARRQAPAQADRPAACRRLRHLDAAQVAAVGEIADGVVVGSALVRLVEEKAGDPDLPLHAGGPGARSFRSAAAPGGEKARRMSERSKSGADRGPGPRPLPRRTRRPSPRAAPCSSASTATAKTPSATWRSCAGCPALPAGCSAPCRHCILSTTGRGM